MKTHQVLLDAFAEARRSWDDLVTLQPDIYAGSRNLTELDLAELARRVEAHQAAIDVLSDALQTEPADDEANRESGRASAAGISNRESATDEAEERGRFPPLDTGSPPPEDAAGRVGEDPLEDTRDRHTSHKVGTRAIAQKEATARYPDRSMPPSRKVAGAFGREPQR